MVEQVYPGGGLALRAMAPTPLDLAVQTVVRRCLAVGEGERVVIAADPPSRALGELFYAEAGGAGAEPVLTMVEPRPNDGAEPPPAVRPPPPPAAFFVPPGSRSLSHTDARRRATEAGARGATLPGVTEDMLARLMSVDFAAMQARCRAVADLLSEAGDAHITCPRGTPLRPGLAGRTGIAD